MFIKPKDADSTTDKKFQFDLFINVTSRHARQVGMMLNSDVQLLHDINVDPINGTTCKVNSNSFVGGPRCNFRENAEQCPPAADDTAGMVRRYAAVSKMAFQQYSKCKNFHFSEL